MNPSSVLDQIRSLWASLGRWQRISVVGAALAVVAGVTAFSVQRSSADFKPVFTGMSAEDAGAVVQKLKESNTEYKLSEDGATVLVPAPKVAESRLQLAAAGLPRTGRIGFELFDQTKLGTTDFAEQVNFRRALEGELERSIRSVAEVESARVHITPPKNSVFLESREPAKASVLLQLKDKSRPAPATVTAICHLVASAVEGLAPADVSVVDGHGNLLSKPKKSQDAGEVSDELIEYRRKLEKDLLAKANATLEPLLGQGHYRMGLSVDCDYSSGEQSEELYDPDKSVMLTSQKSEESASGSTVAGVPGTGSNLPRSAARTVGGGSGVVRRTENISYQSSRTVRKLRLPQGSVRRISASLLLDQTVRWENQSGQLQRVLVPPTEDNIRAIRELVSGAIGLVPSRGDQLVVETLPFDSTLRTPAPAQPVRKGVDTPAGMPAPGDSPLPALPGDWRLWAGGAVAAVLLLAAGLFFFLRKRALRRKAAAAAAAQIAAQQQASLNANEPAALASAEEKALPQSEEERQRMDLELLTTSLRQMITDDPVMAAAVLRSWLEKGA
ncbi:MAG TPA: flagellar basal-body MS-ring/collar protein FliF [Bryobacteraceae bacterium]|nr:flagellar basal-body MS-ring/collar protein FliF [Bryobacteraceae bacterium]